MKTFTMTRKVDAPVSTVWSIAADFTASPGGGITVDVEDRGDAHSHGTGAIRTITIGKVRVREKLESVDPAGKSFTYRILSGAPMKDHHARAEFASNGSSTEVRWNVEFTPKIPGTGWIVANVTRKAINQYLDAVERAAQK